MNFPFFLGVLCLSLFCYALFCVHSSFAIILKGERKLVALLLYSLSFNADITVVCGSCIPWKLFLPLLMFSCYST